MRPGASTLTMCPCVPCMAVTQGELTQKALNAAHHQHAKRVCLLPVAGVPAL